MGAEYSRRQKGQSQSRVNLGTSDGKAPGFSTLNSGVTGGERERERGGGGGGEKPERSEAADAASANDEQDHDARRQGKFASSSGGGVGKLLCFGSKSGKKSSARTDMEDDLESTFSQCPVMIRRQKLLQLRDARPYLTTRQTDLTISTWRIVKNNLGTVGGAMFLRLFETYPDVKGAFGPFRSLSADDARYNIELRAHGLRVLKTVEVVVSKQKDMDELIKHLHELGTKHITFNAKVDYMDIVGQQFLFAIEPVLEDHWNPEVELAWAALFRFMTHVMKESMML